MSELNTFDDRLDEMFLSLEEGLLGKLLTIGALVLGSAFPASGAEQEKDITKDIVKHEGNEDYSYTDTVGKRSVGIGFNIDDNKKFAKKILGDRFDAVYNGKEPINIVDKQTFFDYSLRNALAVSKKYLPDFDDQPDEVKEVVLNMAFNLGNRLHKFKKTKKYLDNKQYENASKEMLDSKWARQVKNRAKELSATIKNLASK